MLKCYYNIEYKFNRIGNTSKLNLILYLFGKMMFLVLILSQGQKKIRQLELPDLGICSEIMD